MNNYLFIVNIGKVRALKYTARKGKVRIMDKGLKPLVYHIFYIFQILTFPIFAIASLFDS